jgi:hypothetical protein
MRSEILEYEIVGVIKRMPGFLRVIVEGGLPKSYYSVMISVVRHQAPLPPIGKCSEKCLIEHKLGQILVIICHIFRKNHCLCKQINWTKSLFAEANQPLFSNALPA